MDITTETWARIEGVLADALELPPEQRVEFVKTACAGDPGLEIEVMGFLAAAGGDDVLDRSAANFFAPLFDDDWVSETTHIGQSFGRYRIVRQVDAGGMGTVYEGWDAELDRRVALKLLHAVRGEDPAIRERFRREARAASSLDHENIGSIYDIGTLPSGADYIVMPLYSGGSLADRLKGGPLAIPQARDWALQLLAALARSHAAGITHRDVKPSNLVIAESGVLKLVDFGIAHCTSEVTITGLGQTLGTVAYMSPEQFRGERADAGNDLWAAGVVIYEMLAGRHPFPGDGGDARRLAILEAKPRPIRELRPEVPAGLANVVETALSKDPARRQQSAQLMADQIAGMVPSPAAPLRRRAGKRWAIVVGVFVTLLMLTTVVVQRWRPAAIPAGVAVPTTKELSAAVLPFTDATGLPEIAWMRSGLSELLITDLAQSPELDLVSSARLHELQSKAGEKPLSPHDVATQTGATVVIRGQILRIEGRLRVSFTVEDPSAGTVRASGSVDAASANRLFQMTDEVGDKVRAALGIAMLPDAGEVSAITTSSIEAWRLYAEGLGHLLQSHTAEAMSSLEQSIDADPDFAQALVALSTLRATLGDQVEADAYLARAIAHADRLPPRMRDSILAYNYERDWSTYPQAITAYQRNIEQFPRVDARQFNLARLFIFHERFGEAVALFEEWMALGVAYAPGFATAAVAYTGSGHPAEGTRRLREFVTKNPDDVYGHIYLAWQLAQTLEIEEATTVLAHAESLAPNDPLIHEIGGYLAILNEDFDGASDRAGRLADLQGAANRYRGAVAAARVELYRGDGEGAMASLDRAIGAFVLPSSDTAMARCFKAEIHLARTEPRAALQMAEEAIEIAGTDWPGIEGRALAVLAHAALGDTASADRREQELQESLDCNPNPAEARLLWWLRGRRRLLEGDFEAAVTALQKAERALPPFVVQLHRHLRSQHVPVWYSLGEAELAAGRSEAAHRWFERVVNAGSGRIDYPIEYVRSQYQLAHIAQMQRHVEASVEYFKRFSALRIWGGDLDRDWAIEALNVLGKNTSRR